MDVSKSTYELLLPIIASINGTIQINSVVANTDGSYTIYACNTLWASFGFNITINGVVYKMISVDPNVSITVTGPSIPSVVLFTLYPPKFYHGSIKATETELNLKVNNNLLQTDKLPMIWLHEPVDEWNVPQDEFAVARTSDCDLYFVGPANFQGWSQDDHYKYAIKPMRQLFSAFYDAMKLSGLVGEATIDKFRTNDLPRFGRYTATTGAEKTIFAQYEMSGTKVGISIPFLRNDVNCCGVPAPPAPTPGSTDEQFNIYFDGILQDSFILPTGVDHNIFIMPSP